MCSSDRWGYHLSEGRGRLPLRHKTLRLAVRVVLADGRTPAEVAMRELTSRGS